ncbi:hypothetical protein HK405_000019 [Cladochytrium tenue]|nr:hypothetical protein HK405_000019 [Cladochytrium tenue]
MGGTFTAMGLVTLLLPETTMRLSLHPTALASLSDAVTTTTTTTAIKPAARLLMQCFGAQATLCGLVLLTAELPRRAFVAFAAGVVPFFAFDWWAWRRARFLTAAGAAGDALGNVVFVGLSWTAVRALAAAEVDGEGEGEK